MKIALISDMHGTLDFSLPKIDLLIIAGDLCPTYRNRGRWETVEDQRNWFLIDFKPWLHNQPVDQVVAIAGNHDWIFDVAKFDVPFISKNFHYLQDSYIEILGLKVYGTPQQPVFNDWAFNRTEEQLEIYYSNIPKGLDILISHCPPYGILDGVGGSKRPRKVGSKALKKRIMKVKPKIVAFGHNHDRYGIEEKYDIKFINCSLLDGRYIMTKEPFILEI